MRVVIFSWATDPLSRLVDVNIPLLICLDILDEQYLYVNQCDQPANMHISAMVNANSA